MKHRRYRHHETGINQVEAMWGKEAALAARSYPLRLNRITDIMDLILKRIQHFLLSAFFLFLRPFAFLKSDLPEIHIDHFHRGICDAAM